MSRFIVVACALLAAPVASAATFNFTRLSSNGSMDLSSQFLLTVSDLGGGNAELRLANTGPLASVITQVYIDDGNTDLASFVSIDNSDGGHDGVTFLDASAGANFPSKPAGFTTSYSAFARSPRPRHGVDPTESVGFTFALSGGTSFVDLISSIEAGALLVGLHVQAQPDGESDAFLSTVSSVPSPASAGLGVVGIAMMALQRRRA